MPRFPSTLGIGAVLALALWILPSEVGAAPSDGGKGKRFRLHIDTDFFGFTHVDFDVPAPIDDEVNVIGFGLGRPTAIDTGSSAYGSLTFFRPTLGLGFGYAFLDTRAIIGGRVAFMVDGYDIGDDNSDSTVVTGQLVPYFRWVFLPGRWARPYLEGRFGFGGSSVHSELDIPPVGVVDRTQHIIWPTVGFGGGVHLFVVDYFSIDLGLNFDYIAPHGRQSGDGLTEEEEEWDKIADVFNLAIVAGFSAWF